jgi:hypothetical protein
VGFSRAKEKISQPIKRCSRSFGPGFGAGRQIIRTSPSSSRHDSGHPHPLNSRLGYQNVGRQDIATDQAIYSASQRGNAQGPSRTSRRHRRVGRVPWLHCGGTNCQLYWSTILLMYVLHVIRRRYGPCDLRTRRCISHQILVFIPPCSSI